MLAFVTEKTPKHPAQVSYRAIGLIRVRHARTLLQGEHIPESAAMLISALAPVCNLAGRGTFHLADRMVLRFQWILRGNEREQQVR